MLRFTFFARSSPLHSFFSGSKPTPERHAQPECLTASPCHHTQKQAGRLGGMACGDCAACKPTWDDNVFPGIKLLGKGAVALWSHEDGLLDHLLPVLEDVRPTRTREYKYVIAPLQPSHTTQDLSIACKRQAS